MPGPRLLLLLPLLPLLGSVSALRRPSVMDPFSALDWTSNRRRHTIVLGDPFASHQTLVPRRPRYFFWTTENFLGWTNWTSCRRRSCRRFRYRQCRRGRRCPSDFLVEMTRCQDAPGCADKYNVTLEQNVNGTCGIRPQAALKILGGRSSRPHSWPWQAGLFIAKRGEPSRLPSCGATLIGARWVLTAAHCLVVSYWPRQLPIGRPFRPAAPGLQVRLGDHDVQKVDAYEAVFSVREVVIHPGFKLRLGSCHNDVALLRLDRDATLHQRLNLACLPSAGMRLPAGTRCVALGWGVVQARRRSFLDWFRPAQPARARVLQEVQIPLVAHRDCRREYPGYTLSPAAHLCAGQPGKDTCKGDSGGPLMCPVTSTDGVRRWFLYGVTSFGSQSGCGRSFGVYSRVSHFTAWIRQTQARSQ